MSVRRYWSHTALRESILALQERPGQFPKPNKVAVGTLIRTTHRHALLLRASPHLVAPGSLSCIAFSYRCRQRRTCLLHRLSRGIMRRLCPRHSTRLEAVLLPTQVCKGTHIRISPCGLPALMGWGCKEDNAGRYRNTSRRRCSCTGVQRRSRPHRNRLPQAAFLHAS